VRIVQLLSHDRIKSGGATQALLLARGQRARGHEVALVHNEGREPELASESFAPLVEEGFRCEAIPMQNFARIAGLKQFTTFLDDYQPDVVHAHRERALGFALSAIAKRERPALIAQKGNCSLSDAATARSFRSPRIDRIVAVAEAVKRILVLHDGVTPEKIDVVYGSYDRSRFSERVPMENARRALGVPVDGPVVGILSNIDKKKGHRRFFAVAAEVHARRPAARFVVVGGGEVARAEEEAAHAGVGDAVTFTGFRADAEVALSAFDVSVNSSTDSEGLSGALRESMALGVPVVCTNVAGNSELVENGVTGRLVPPMDNEAMAAAIIDALDRPEDSARMAAAGRARVAEWMDDDRRNEQVLAVYEDVLRWRRGTFADAGIEGCLHPDVPMFEAPDPISE